MSEQRLQALETKLAFLEHTLEEVNKVVYQQSIQLDKLEQHNVQLTKRLQDALVQPADASSQHELPPHY